MGYIKNSAVKLDFISRDSTCIFISPIKMCIRMMLHFSETYICALYVVY
jgi:hypothetical protein